MESALNSPLQAIAGLIFVPLHALFIAGITKVLCEWWTVKEIDPWISENDLVLLGLMLAMLIAVCWAKHRLRIHSFWIELVTALVAVAVCLNRW